MSEESGKKIYCANCFNCKTLTAKAADGEDIPKIRCAAGHWKKNLGGEKLYRLDKAHRRTVYNCPDYEPTGDPRSLIRELKRRSQQQGSKDDAPTVD